MAATHGKLADPPIENPPPNQPKPEPKPKPQGGTPRPG